MKKSLNIKKSRNIKSKGKSRKSLKKSPRIKKTRHVKSKGKSRKSLKKSPRIKKTRHVKSKRKSRESLKKSPKKIVILEKSKVSTKKFAAIIGNKTVNFGAKGYSDYTLHKDEDRMHRYENRHKRRENWKKSGIKTAGFWSKWILWNKPSFNASIKDTEKRFNIKIINKTR